MKNKNILGVQGLISGLSSKNQELINRIFYFSLNESRMIIPDSLKESLKGKFNIADLESQHVLRVDNKLTNESSIFNSLRSKRPMQKSDSKIEIKDKVDPFLDVEKKTPADVFGRIKSKYSITASNLTKYNKHHSLVIFKNKNPFKISYPELSDALDTAIKWFDKSHSIDKNSRFPFLIWNFLWKAGASIVHPHLQVLLTNKPFPSEKTIFDAIETYHKRYNRDYINDFFVVHKLLGLAFEKNKIQVIAHLTPIKENEVMIIGDYGINLKKAVFKAFKNFLSLGVESFDLSMIAPPFDSDIKMPFIVRMVDRGRISSLTTDFGAMEVYSGSDVVASDPFFLIKSLLRSFKK